MPWFKVQVKASQIIVLKARNSTEAASIAFEEAFDGISECHKECEHPEVPILASELDCEKRHADVVFDH